MREGCLFVAIEREAAMDWLGEEWQPAASLVCVNSWCREFVGSNFIGNVTDFMGTGLGRLIHQI
jgi:hypothetical protein